MFSSNDPTHIGPERRCRFSSIALRAPVENLDRESTTYVRTYVCTNICAYVRRYLCMYIHTYLRTYVRAFVRIDTYVRTYVHTYVRTYVCTYIRRNLEFNHVLGGTCIMCMELFLYPTAHHTKVLCRCRTRLSRVICTYVCSGSVTVFWTVAHSVLSALAVPPASFG